LISFENGTQELLLFFLRRLVVKTTGLDDLVVDIEFIPCTGIHRFFHTLLCDEPQDSDRLRLANTVGAVLGLQIGMGVPI